MGKRKPRPEPPEPINKLYILIEDGKVKFVDTIHHPEWLKCGDGKIDIIQVTNHNQELKVFQLSNKTCDFIEKKITKDKW